MKVKRTIHVAIHVEGREEDIQAAASRFREEVKDTGIGETESDFDLTLQKVTVTVV